MLFNSNTFLFVFLPITLLGFFIVGKVFRRRGAVLWLGAASLVFYGWRNPAFVPLIIGSIGFNYLVGGRLIDTKDGARGRSALFAIGLIGNIGLLVYFKYARFIVVNLNWAFAQEFSIPQIALPLAISFFTFQQIAFLVDAYVHKVHRSKFGSFWLFVSFFPQLIAGPIIHHSEVLTQFSRPLFGRFLWKNIIVGFAIFTVGFFKKVVLADSLDVYATDIFARADTGAIDAWSSWLGAMAWNFQVYYDFSGYSDMAIGIAWMMDIRLPLNFYSPFKAAGFVDFWKRWHITLSRFLRDYVFMLFAAVLGRFNGNGVLRVVFQQFVPLMLTMFICGLWHGAGWTFVLWGVAHGILLVLNQAAGMVLLRTAFGTSQAPHIKRFRLWSARLLTFWIVVLVSVIFRANTVDGAFSIYTGMMSAFNGAQLDVTLAALVAAVCLHSWFFPNTHQFFGSFSPSMDTYGRDSTAGRGDRWWQFKPNYYWGVTMVALFLLSVAMMRPVAFIYFEF